MVFLNAVLPDLSSVVLFGACIDGVVLRDKWVVVLYMYRNTVFFRPKGAPDHKVRYTKTNFERWVPHKLVEGQLAQPELICEVHWIIRRTVNL